jgi:bifunctional non-homologous end joining protein LigD
MLAFKDGRHVRLISRRGVDLTARFADIAAAVAELPARVLVLDGEVCVFDAQLVSQFHLLGESSTGELATPPVFIAFDLLRAGPRDLRDRPLSYRRPALEDAIAGSRYVLPALPRIRRARRLAASEDRWLGRARREARSVILPRRLDA